MPRNGPIFQDHHAIEQRTLERSPLLKALADSGHFDIHAPENRILLPADPAFAQTLGVTPHSGGPIADYQIGLQQRLRRLEQTPDGANALNGDPLALQRITGRVEALRDNVRVGLINGDLYTNAPHGLKSNDIRPQVQSFFFNEAAYGQIHAPQLQQLKGFTPLDNGWAAVTHQEQRVVTTVQHAQTISNPLTRGGDGELQRQGLSQAISNAYQSGRLTMTPRGIAIVENSLGVEAAKPLRVPRAQGFATMDLLIGEASASQLVRSGGLLASGADAILTTRRISEHLQQGNGTAAQSEFNHALARSGGGWLGGMATASVIGTSSFVPAAVVAADALFMSKAFDKGADLLDNRAVYHQEAAGAQWKFNGLNWQRQAKMQDSSAGVGETTEHSVGANYETARELGAKASVKAVELALKDAPAPQNPFSLPAAAHESSGFGNPNWQRDPQTEQWTRQVKTGVTGANDRGLYETQIATPERAVELNQQAVQRIADNIAHGKAAIAASYLENRAATRASDFVPVVPDAVEAARARPDAILGSDNVRYQRDGAGNWSHEGRAAQGNMALELEATRTIQQPSIDVLDQAIAALEARPAPTHAEMNQNEVRHTYAAAGITPSPQWMEAIELATARTRAQHGITGPTMQQLAPPTEGNAGESRAITHYQVDADGVARPVATTTTEELRAAWQEVRALAAGTALQPGAQRADPLQPGGADYALHQQIRAGVAALDAQHGRAADAVSDRMTASLLVLAKENDLSRVDQVVLSAATGHQPAGHTVFLIKGDLSSPPFTLATMTTDRAVATPVEVSMQRYQQMNQEAQQQSAARQVEQQAQDGRVQGMGRE
ncbi:XVIPCD domain-containing protein [Stenotrophomonas sp.]|uniref:XVIPCD domain-containing protein n=1 Tax=Stenotrophomonas sp. TaxID=69392 RepID=UPI002D3D02A3|nr:XVIPCD domain-containing protein [Stenotrophomonas sp.]HYQ23726.1 XVIPCD domain-containing protein [Stenotrophomonas sp.]